MPLNLWRTRFHLTRELPGFPRPSTVASDLVRDASYYFEGRDRARHDNYLFKYTLAGEGRFSDAARDYPLPAGHAFLCQICDPDTRYFYPPDHTEPWRHLYFSFRGGHAMVRELVGRFGYVYRVPDGASVIARLADYERYAGSHVEVTPGEGATLVMDLLAMLADAASELTASSPHAWLIRQARRLVAAHLEERYNVADLAADLDVSREHLCRVFKSETGTTPHAHILHLKMRRACELLRDTTGSCNDVARSLGFDNSSHFARTFKRAVGTTPLAYRRTGAVAPD